MAIAVLLTGCEALLPFLKVEWFPGGVLALISCIVVMSAFLARLVAQKNLKGDC